MGEYSFRIIATSDEEGLVGHREEIIRIKAKEPDIAFDLAGYFALSAKSPDKDGWYFQCIEALPADEASPVASHRPRLGAVGKAA